MKLNKKGYMLVEIIVSFALTFAIMISMINLVLSFKNKNEDIYYEAKYLKDKNLITRNIMDDLKKINILDVEEKDNNLFFIIEYLNKENKFTGGTRRLSINNNTITYGEYDYDNNVFKVSENSYYSNELEPSLKIEGMDYNLTDYNLNIKIKVKSIYSDQSYDINLFVPKINIKYYIRENCTNFENYYFLNAIFSTGMGTIDQRVPTSGVFREDLKDVKYDGFEQVKLCKNDDECEMTYYEFYDLLKKTIANNEDVINYFSENTNQINNVNFYREPNLDGVIKKYITSGGWKTTEKNPPPNDTISNPENDANKLANAVLMPDTLKVEIDPDISNIKEFIESKEKDYIPIIVSRIFTTSIKERVEKNEAVPVNGMTSGVRKPVVLSPAMYKIKYYACENIKVPI